ncbi:hypothetical protein PUNSTDRAFT_29276, partial [Punctularia strigosozonata HHB-11173 SS5]|uniref:uncharacterized protein n=1 Tax=Punctularia strigosozonata (strain HHB-11173) TaxID=741275 RepID=UPI00044174F5
KYALQEGQPINSVLDGVLPLHAAASGGSEIVVRLLIDAGADVNAPRLPRRYITSSSSHPSHHHDRHKADRDRDRDREPRMPVGTSGSTPLHFAAANGHE